MLAPAYVTRTGVFVYRNADGTQRREFRPADEVFAEDSLASLVGAPVTEGHPKAPVTPDTWRQVSIGHVSSPPIPDGDKVQTTLAIQDAPAIRRIDAGEISEVSLGYTTRLDWTPGETPEGERYDAVQRDIRYNHVALGPRNWGRAGAEVSLRLDAADNQIEDSIMRLIRIDGTEYEAGSEAHLAKVDEMHKTELQQVQTRCDEAQAKADQAERTVTELQAKLDEALSQSRVDSLVADRLSLIDKARSVLGLSYEFAGVSDKDLMVAAIRADQADFDAVDKSDDYIRAFFDAVISKPSRNDSVSRAREAVASPPQTTEPARRTAEQARQDMLEANAKMSQQPLRFNNYRQDEAK